MKWVRSLENVQGNVVHGYFLCDKIRNEKKYAKNAEAVLDSSKEVGIEVIKYMFVSSHHQHLGQNHNFMIANKTFENVVKFKYVGTKATYQDSSHKDINSRLK
jgi:hypothetical protein